jgi:hypothetical protein
VGRRRQCFPLGGQGASINIPTENQEVCTAFGSLNWRPPHCDVAELAYANGTLTLVLKLNEFSPRYPGEKDASLTLVFGNLKTFRVVDV